MDFLTTGLLLCAAWGAGLYAGWHLRQWQLSLVYNKIITELEGVFKYVRELEIKVKEYETKQ